MRELGDDWSDKPVRVPSRVCDNVTKECLLQVDMLQWVVEAAMARKSDDYRIAERMFLVNFAALHTTSTVRPIFPVLPSGTNTLVQPV